MNKPTIPSQSAQGAAAPQDDSGQSGAAQVDSAQANIAQPAPVQLEAVGKEYALRAIEKTEGWLNKFSNIDTSGELRGVLADKFHETCKRAGLTYSDFEKLWARTSELAKNPAMAEFLLDSRACDSDFFVPWQNAVPRAVILEAAYGYGYDLKGTYRHIPETDPFQVWVEHDAGFKFARWRDRYYANALIDNHCRNILFLGAGWLPELRYTDFFDRGWDRDSRITCCDLDATIDKNFIFPPEVAKQVDYHHVGLVEMLMDVRAKGAKYDGVFAKGVMSYCMDNLSTTIGVVLELLEPGKRFVFDLQTPHWSMLRNGYVFGWGSDGAIRLLPTDQIVSIVNEACSGVPHASISYDEDPTDREPVGVVVTITR